MVMSGNFETMDKINKQTEHISHSDKLVKDAMHDALNDLMSAGYVCMCVHMCVGVCMCVNMNVIQTRRYAVCVCVCVPSICISMM